MTRPTSKPLPDFVVRLADTKYVLGQRFSEWTSGAPTLEAAVAAAAMTQDELGHARSLYAALQHVPDSPDAYLREEKRDHRLNPPVLNTPFTSWAEFVAASALWHPFPRAGSVTSLLAVGIFAFASSNPSSSEP